MPKRKVSNVKRSKAGKGKKDGKQELKPDKESDMEKVKANAALWELRLHVSDRALAQYREEHHKLARAHGELTDQLHRQERDAVDITRYLNGQNAAKEEKIDMLQTSLEHQEVRAREEQNKLVEDYTLRINELHELFRNRSGDFDKIQDGMKQMREFEKTKAEMERELVDIRNAMEAAGKAHRENLNEMEFRFFKEKARLEREAEEKIALVVERAHGQAATQLDDASRSVFKENVRLNEALKHHMKETEDLQKLTASLAKRNASLTLDKNMLELTVKDNAAQLEAQREKLSTLRAKVASLEQTLEGNARESEHQKDKEETTLACVPDSRAELDKLEKALAQRDEELAHIKRIARTVVEQRTELESFFHDALAQVRQEIAASRQQCTKEALRAYRSSLSEAAAGKLRPPPVCSPRNANPVHSNVAPSERWTHQPGSRVELCDLTWAQKEHVLRLLFAKMNGQSQRKTGRRLPVSAPPPGRAPLTEALQSQAPEECGTYTTPQLPPCNYGSSRFIGSAFRVGLKKHRL